MNELAPALVAGNTLAYHLLISHNHRAPYHDLHSLRGHVSRRETCGDLVTRNHCKMRGSALRSRERF